MDLSAVSAPSTAWELVDYGMNGVPGNALTDAAVRYIKAMQTPEGNWSSNESRRPPMNAGDFQAAAVSIYAIKHYGPPGEKVSNEQAVARAVAWLDRASPDLVQDRAFQAIGLAWAGAASARATERRPFADRDATGRRWLESDARDGIRCLRHRPGALRPLLAGTLSMNDPAYRKGIDYLLRTQAADGSWHVKSRSIWLQPYFESGFPYGQDQFISAAGTAWASMALATAVQPATATRR